ncbi:MAG: hypothetical protein KGH97_02685 [Patescibacteria group bacterium]|nr:hypothetical protein [Patescibacteria group bacterium]
MKIATLSLIGSIGILFAAAPALAASATSANWSGYVADTGAYTGVGASWVVPSAAARAGLASDAEWVGIGGERSDDLIQAGTEAVIEDGAVSYQGWYELLPAGQRIVPLALHPGDRVSVSLIETAPDTWQLSFLDATTGASYSTALAYASSHSSADWIVEAPVAVSGARSGVVPLDEFGSVSFAGAYAIEGGARETASEAGATAITMARGAVALAAPSALAGGAFSVARSEAGAAAPRARYRADAVREPFPLARRIVIIQIGF